MFRYLPLLACLLLASPARAEQAPLQFYTEEYAPVSFLQNGIADGMASELVRALLQRLGETASIQVVPWSRGYHIVQNTPGTALFATIRNAEREPHFKWVGPIMLAQDAYYGLKGSGLKIDQPAQLRPLEGEGPGQGGQRDGQGRQEQAVAQPCGAFRPFLRRRRARLPAAQAADAGDQDHGDHDEAVGEVR